MNKTENKVLIIGLGLIGGSYAMGLMKKGYHVYALTKDQEDIDFALEHHYIEGGTTKVDASYLKQFDRFIFALYPKVFLNWIHEYKDLLPEGSLMSDVTGVKGAVVYEIQKELGDKVEYIPAHPMAGREVYGVRNANDQIFHNANYIITPTDRNTTKGIDYAYCIGRDLDFAKISILTPEKHDEMIAFLSQLTHCIAVSLMSCKDSIHLSEYTGDSFRDLTRIANINEDMWCELFLMNKDHLLAETDLFISEITKLRDAISREDTETIKEMMRVSTHRRSYFNKKE